MDRALSASVLLPHQIFSLLLSSALAVSIGGLAIGALAHRVRQPSLLQPSI
jgi:hypothetical protein